MSVLAIGTLTKLLILLLNAHSEIWNISKNFYIDILHLGYHKFFFSNSSMKHIFTLKRQFCTSTLWTSGWVRIWNTEQHLPALVHVNSLYTGDFLTLIKFMMHLSISDVRRANLKAYLELQLALLFVPSSLFLMSLQSWSPFQL